MSISARRQVLANVQLNEKRFPHAGLWLDKFLPKQFAQGQPGGEGAYRDHFEQAVTIPVADVYTSSFNRWKHTLEASGVKTKVATTQGRLVVGLGAESVLENAITLHRTYGVPVIPGSALKGLAAAYARNRLAEPDWQKGGEAYKTLFGDTESAGYVTFFDALYVPHSAEENRPLALDVVTVHHQEYYRGENSPPADWDSPNPVPFVSVRARVKFLVALAGPEEWVEAAFQILGLALAEEGIGAKTNSGYGRMVLEGYAKGAKQGSSASATDEKPELERFRLRLEGMASKDVAGQIYSVYQEWKNLESDTETKRRIAQMILDKIESAGRTKKSQKKKWFQELVAFVEEGGNE
ncbi:MAG: type III-B CRISPR module RAMP protein Cmr6 [Ardenticatenia bacterium]|nr:MAG: type III-B CRISPR module RAMP protein Cmr6 [Ardenticatenia bacterium]